MVKNCFDFVRRQALRLIPNRWKKSKRNQEEIASGEDSSFEIQNLEDLSSTTAKFNEDSKKPSTIDRCSQTEDPITTENPKNIRESFENFMQPFGKITCDFLNSRVKKMVQLTGHLNQFEVHHIKSGYKKVEVLIFKKDNLLPIVNVRPVLTGTQMKIITQTQPLFLPNYVISYQTIANRQIVPNYEVNWKKISPKPLENNIVNSPDSGLEQSILPPENEIKPEGLTGLNSLINHETQEEAFFSASDSNSFTLGLESKPNVKELIKKLEQGLNPCTNSLVETAEESLNTFMQEKSELEKQLDSFGISIDNLETRMDNLNKKLKFKIKLSAKNPE